MERLYAAGYVGPLNRRERQGFPILSKFMRPGARTISVEEAEVAEVAEVVPEVLTQEEEVQYAEAEALQKQEVEQLGLTKPQHMGTHTNWKGDSAEVWYYPEAKLYGVVVPSKPSLNTGPRYESLADAAAYARGAIQTEGH